MSAWFEGSIEISCSMEQLVTSFEDSGQHFHDVVSLMPGITSVELLEQGQDFVKIKTNEGLMTRKNISKISESDRLVVEFDEEYQAGSMGTVKTHYYNEFKTNDELVTYRAILNVVEAPGILGFFYRTFGKSSIGNAVLNSYKTYFTKQK